MSDMITTLAFYMRFPFVRYALIVGVLIGAVLLTARRNAGFKKIFVYR